MSSNFGLLRLGSAHGSNRRIKWRSHQSRCARVWTFPAVMATIFVAASLPGCGSSLAKVSGTVTVDGQPLRGGNDVRVTIQFEPASGSGPMGFGHADENGVYTVSTGSKSGLPPGEYFVACSAVQLIPAKDPSMAPGGRRLTDMKYASARTSGLKLTVQPGSNQFDIPLQGAAKTSPRRGT